MKKILLCPLDWGLGHATRCIPVIKELRRQGADVFIASAGSALALLKLEFPALRFFELPPYNPVYPERMPMPMKMLLQLPKFRKVVKEEQIVVEKLVVEHEIDAVISDNRYGCRSARARSIFITHQSNLLMPPGFGWASRIVNFFVHRYVQEFAEVWIPDQPDSGLSAPFSSSRIRNKTYIGWLSRFTPRPAAADIKYEIIALVSGPEPQRAIFERILLAQLKAAGKKSLLVGGEPHKPYHQQDGVVEIVNHLSASEMEVAIWASSIVVCRSGYSTVMDLIALGKRAIFIPTPQQPEQIFLAEHFHSNHLALAVNQRKFSLLSALEQSRTFKGLTNYVWETSHLSAAVNRILQ